jgi:lysophospholipase L1-like esterase
MPTLACIGASLTEGTVSANYVELLQKRFPDFRVVNAGANGDLAWNTLQRLDKVIDLQPDFVFMLLGTNDVNCTLSERNRLRYLEFNRLPVQFPDMLWYEENYGKIVSRLLEETPAKLALATLPMIGEDLNHEANQRVPKYNEVIARIAQERQATLLPVHEKMVEYLKSHEADRASLPPMLAHRDGIINVSNATALRKQGMTWNEISARNGLLLTTDCLHLNDTAAEMVAQMVADWLQRVV